jgi:flagellar motor switch protein FliN/FliY
MVDEMDDKEQSTEETPDASQDQASPTEGAGNGPDAEAAAGAALADGTTEGPFSEDIGATGEGADPQQADNAEPAAAWADAVAETGGADNDSAGDGPSAISEAPAHPVDFPELGTASPSQGSGNIGLLMDVKLPVSIELGRTTQPIADILQWGQGSIVELDRLAGEPVNLLVNDRLVAKGEVVVVDENFGLRITNLVVGRDRDAQR